MYSQGKEFVGRHEGDLLFIAYHVPAIGVPSVESPAGVGSTENDSEETGVDSQSGVGTEESDTRRRRDLQSIRDALRVYYEENGTYPDTNDFVQTACVFPELDQLCIFADQLGKNAFFDPRGDPNTYGYWYSSDGSAFTLYATLLSPPSPDETCLTDDPLLSKRRNLYCLGSED